MINANVRQRNWKDKLLAFAINVVARTIEVWVALVILNWLGIMPT